MLNGPSGLKASTWGR